MCLKWHLCDILRGHSHLKWEKYNYVHHNVSMKWSSFVALTKLVSLQNCLDNFSVKVNNIGIKLWHRYLKFIFSLSSNGEEYAYCLVKILTIFIPIMFVFLHARREFNMGAHTFISLRRTILKMNDPTKSKSLNKMNEFTEWYRFSAVLIKVQRTLENWEMPSLDTLSTVWFLI